MNRETKTGGATLPAVSCSTCLHWRDWKDAKQCRQHGELTGPGESCGLWEPTTPALLAWTLAAIERQGVEIEARPGGELWTRGADSELMMVMDDLVGELWEHCHQRQRQRQGPRRSRKAGKHAE